MGPAWRWVAAVASGVAVFEGLDALAIRAPEVAWLTLASPFIAGAVAGWGAGCGPATRLLAAGAVAWGRIGGDRAVGLMVHEQLRDYPLPTFEQEVLLPNKLGIADYDRLVRNEAAIRQLIAAASVSARLVSPAEAESLWRKENQEVAGQLAVFWTSNYLDKVAITNGAISNFYTLRIAQYRVPDPDCGRQPGRGGDDEPDARHQGT